MGKKRATINRNNLLQGTGTRRRRQFSEPKTLPAFHPRVANARHKISLAKERLPHWRAVAEWCGDVHKATACCRIKKDLDFCPSIKLVEMIEAAQLPPEMREVPACPDCGAVHTGRCHGVPDPVVVIRKQRPAPDHWRDMPVAVLRQAILNRQPCR